MANPSTAVSQDPGRQVVSRSCDHLPTGKMSELSLAVFQGWILYFNEQSEGNWLENNWTFNSLGA